MSAHGPANFRSLDGLVLEQIAASCNWEVGGATSGRVWEADVLDRLAESNVIQRRGVLVALTQLGYDEAIRSLNFNLCTASRASLKSALTAPDDCKTCGYPMNEENTGWEQGGMYKGKPKRKRFCKRCRQHSAEKREARTWL